MSKYYIKSWHDIYEDSYQQGLGKMTNHYEMNGIIEADSTVEALELYGQKVLGYEYDEHELNVTDDVISCDVLVNEDCMEATADEIRRWEKGKLKLYNDWIVFEIHKMEKIINLE